MIRAGDDDVDDDQDCLLTGLYMYTLWAVSFSIIILSNNQYSKVSPSSLNMFHCNVLNSSWKSETCPVCYIPLSVYYNHCCWLVSDTVSLSTSLKICYT